jgi:hypothetical protein
LVNLAAAVPGLAALAHAGAIPESATPGIIVPTDKEPVATGQFEPTWNSLRH